MLDVTAATGVEGRRFQLRPAAECGTVLADKPSGGPYRRGTPVIRGQADPRNLAALRRIATRTVTPPPARVVLLRGATVRGPGVVTLPDGSLVEESLINCTSTEDVAGLRRVDPGSFVGGANVEDGRAMAPGRYVLMKQRWDQNYGHWLIEGLPRIDLLSGIVDLSECRFLVSDINPAMRRVYVDSLAAFGVREEQVVPTGLEPLHVQELIYPLPLTVQPWVKAPLAVRVLEAMAERLLAKRGRPWRANRLFVCRPEGSRRRPLHNQEEIAEFLLRRGYAVVTPALMSFEEQVAAFFGARRIVGTLGAECSNIAFAATGARFLGLAPEGMQNDFFYDLISHKSGRYLCLHGASERPQDGMNSPFSIELDALRTMLEEV